MTKIENFVKSADTSTWKEVRKIPKKGWNFWLVFVVAVLAYLSHLIGSGQVWGLIHLPISRGMASVMFVAGFVVMAVAAVALNILTRREEKRSWNTPPPEVSAQGLHIVH